MKKGKPRGRINPGARGTARGRRDVASREADASGGDRWAATELYSLVQRKRDAEEAALREEADRLAPQSLIDQARNPSYREILEGMVSRDGEIGRASCRERVLDHV